MAEKKKGFDLASALGSVSDSDTGAREQLQYIDIAHILPDPENFYSMEGLDDLAGSIELLGLQQPLRVRPGDGPGNFIIVSGHRRHAALKRLVEDGKEAFRLVPCLIDGREESEAMRKLRLIFANSGTRKLTPADLDRQAQEVEEALYQLQAEGIEFPGRMRDYVAEVCKVKASKLGELKVIREKLIVQLQGDWKSGIINQSVAYAFAKEAPEVQVLIIQYITKWGTDNLNRKLWREYEVKYAAERVNDELKSKKGPKGSCDQCDAQEQRLKRCRQNYHYGDHCYDGKCCHGCPNMGTCPSVCAHLSAEVAKAKEKAKAQQAADKEAQEKENAKQVAPTVKLWKRFGEARAAAGLTFEEYAKKANVRYFTREKKVADFEQGQKITPRSGGLPYDGGDGVMEWRIRPLIRAADALGCSVDYLLCRTDIREMAKAVPAGDHIVDLNKMVEAPKWQTGEPPAVGRYYCLVELEGEKMPMMLKWRGHYWGMAGGGGLNYGTVIGWWPLPNRDDEPEEAFRTEENDDGD